ncbi:MAG: nickel pincer cofactor biosynthesis protein LarC [Kiritimatiellae bacterium]|nr:nickel pincer cofactor biosynthesis protein LarC [Kiritimatiellia bacterium]
MKTLYLDCGMGAAGDMLAAALLELFPKPDEVVAELNRLAIPRVRFLRETVQKCGITGTHLSVQIDGEEEGEPHDRHQDHHHHQGHDHGGADHHHEHSHHHHHGMQEIESIVAGLHLPPPVEKNVLAVYGLIADAESRVHNKPVTEIHFHEVGAMDAIADITAVCYLLDKLNPARIVASPVHAGTGTVACAHGILPVPAPATALLLQGVPIYGGRIQGELCTPTGAALLKRFVHAFGEMPVIRTAAIGYGMGKKDFPQANCLRAIWGETEDETEFVPELSCNLDDMTGEAVAFAVERLFEAGALEAYTVPIGMKKSRPGILLRVLCRPEDREKIVALIFRHTTTNGIRETATRRYVLDRTIETVQTEYGEIRRKTVCGYGVTRSKYEYEDLARIARERGVSMYEIRPCTERKY